jgi:hypothetical protein
MEGIVHKLSKFLVKVLTAVNIFHNNNKTETNYIRLK